MLNRFRSFVAALAIAGLVLGHATSALAASPLSEVDDDPSAVPMVFDVLVLRPIGLTMTVLGTLVYVFPVAPIMALTRPTEITKPIGPLVGVPARFTFRDPIGQHP